MRDLQPRVPERPKPTDAQAKAQGAVEAAQEGITRGEETSVRVPRTQLLTPRPLPRTRRSRWYQEAFPKETQ